MTDAQEQVPEWTLPDRLRKARERAGLSQQDMADYLGLTRQALGKYETGRIAPKTQTLRVWAMRTGVPFEWLQTGEISPPRMSVPTLVMSTGRGAAPAEGHSSRLAA